MSIEEVERILDETQEAVEYQRVGVAVPLGPPFCLSPANERSGQLGECPRATEAPAIPCPVASLLLKGGDLEARLSPPCGLPSSAQAHASPQLLLLQQIDELLAGSFTQEDEDAILQELNAITQVRGLRSGRRDGTVQAPACHGWTGQPPTSGFT